MEERKLYAALKLIEQLYLDQLLPEDVYQDILDDYHHLIDMSKFTRTEKDKEETVA